MTYLQHAIMALIAQFLVWLATGDWWLGAAIASAYFIGRELSQAEYRWIEAYGIGRRSNLPWWGRFDLRVWPKLDQWVDWIAPLVVTVLLALLLA